jgi:hypothetical protein
MPSLRRRAGLVADGLSLLELLNQALEVLLVLLVGRLLAALARAKLVDARQEAAWHAHAGWKGRLRRLDRRFLDGRMPQISRRFRSRAGAAET